MQPHVNENLPWEYIEPAPLNKKILLLTKDNQCLVGVWKGEPMPHNKTFKAWQGLLKRDKALEKSLGYV